MEHTNSTTKKRGFLKPLAHSLGALLFILFFFSLNPFLVKRFEGISEADRVFEEKDEVIYNLDGFGAKDGLSESVYLSGWAFCETEKPNDNKDIWVVFLSDKKAYAIQTTLIRRVDVVDYVVDNYKGTKAIQGVMHGFNTEFSTLSMPSGTYDICLYCRENDENYGLQPTTLRLRKNGRETVFLEAWE